MTTIPRYDTTLSGRDDLPYAVRDLATGKRILFGDDRDEVEAAVDALNEAALEAARPDGDSPVEFQKWAADTHTDPTGVRTIPSDERDPPGLLAPMAGKG